MALRAVTEHPKFAALKALIGAPKGVALGWLESVWHFTGRFTPHGNLGKYADQQIEAWVEWNGAPGALIAALVETGWIDRSAEHRLLVHDWAQHADNATKLAVKRSGKPFCAHTVEMVLPRCGDTVEEAETPCGLPVPVPGAGPVPEPEPEKDKSAPSGVCERFVSIWNENCGHLSKVLKLTKERRAKLRTRMAEGLTEEVFSSAVVLCATTPFTAGKTTEWKSDFDWLIETETNLTKVMEGKYAGANPTKGSSPTLVPTAFDLKRQQAIAEAEATERKSA